MALRVLVTAGPTYEKIDPVRFIGNYSTGKMGFAIAEAFAEEGAEVSLIAGPVSLSVDSPSIVRTGIESAQEMYEAVMQRVGECDVAVFCAAVADFTPEQRSEQKIKRKGEDMLIRLRPTQDIAAAAGSGKKSGQIFVGFALETIDEEANARGKMSRKGLDMIVLNSLRDEGAGFGYDTNKVTILTVEGEKTSLPLQSKAEVARHIVERVLEKIRKRGE